MITEVHLTQKYEFEGQLRRTEAELTGANLDADFQLADEDKDLLCKFFCNHYQGFGVVPSLAKHTGKVHKRSGAYCEFTTSLNFTELLSAIRSERADDPFDIPQPSNLKGYVLTMTSVPNGDTI